jgi:hypothetical protein
MMSPTEATATPRAPAPTAPHPLWLRAVQLSRASDQFDRLTDGLLLDLRRAMGVPEHAEPEVEAEFATLRGKLSEMFHPEFVQMYGSLLARYLGPAASVVVNSLADEDVQAYLQVADAIEADFAIALQALAPQLAAALAPSA